MFAFTLGWISECFQAVVCWLLTEPECVQNAAQLGKRSALPSHWWSLLLQELSLGKNAWVCGFCLLLGRAIFCKALLWPFSNWERLETVWQQLLQFFHVWQTGPGGPFHSGVRVFCQPISFLWLMTFTAHSGQLQLISYFHPLLISLSFLENEVWRCSWLFLYAKPSDSQCWKGTHTVVIQLMPNFGGDWKRTCPCKAQSYIGEILIALIFQGKLVVNYNLWSLYMKTLSYMLNFCRTFFLEKNVENYANIPRE